MQNVSSLISAARHVNNTFAQSVVSQYDRRGSISEKQYAALKNMLQRKNTAPAQTGVVSTFKRPSSHVQPANEPTVRPGTSEVDVSRIEALFDTARSNGLKRLKYRAEGLSIKPAPEHGMNPGGLYVNDSNGEYIGKIVGGVYHPNYKAQPTVGATLQAIASDPLAVGRAYGMKTGRCCVCGIELTDPVSIANGIGPICQSNWGM